jgi:hypothetical protein
MIHSFLKSKQPMQTENKMTNERCKESALRAPYGATQKTELVWVQSLKQDL